MKIVVCVKAVPAQVTRLWVAETQDRINHDGRSVILDEGSEYALEEGLALRRQFGGELTAVMAGSLFSQHALHLAVAKGADRVVRVDTGLTDGESVSLGLAEAIRGGNHDLVLTGVESSDGMAAQVGVFVAERLGIPFASGVTKIELAGDRKSVIVTKELGSGVRQVLEMPLPAVLCIQPGMLPLSYVPFSRLQQARTRPVTSLSVVDSVTSGRKARENRQLRITDVFPAKRRRQAEIIEGTPSEAAETLMTKIEEVIKWW